MLSSLMGIRWAPLEMTKLGMDEDEDVGEEDEEEETVDHLERKVQIRTHRQGQQLLDNN